MKAALSDSLQAENDAVKHRFEKAESLFQDQDSGTTETAAKPTPSPSLRSPDPSPKNQSVKPMSRKKVIRDSFTLPEDDYGKIADLKERCLGLAKNVTKSEIMRAGLYALEALSDDELLSRVERLEKVKTGRPSQRQ
jgi:hypothetical protein